VTAVRTLVDDPGLAVEFGRRGRQAVLQDYAIESVRDRYQELIHGEEEVS
jgi:hypothetical protein